MTLLVPAFADAGPVWAWCRWRSKAHCGFWEAVLLLVMAVGKFRLDPAADIGDKSVFEELEHRRRTV